MINNYPEAVPQKRLLRSSKQELMIFIKAILGRSYARIVGANRESSWILFETIMPLLVMSAYIFIYKAMGAPPQFAGYVIIGAAMTTFWMTVMWSMAMQFFWEKEMGNLQLYLIIPTSRMAILLGMAFGGMIMSSTRVASILVIGIWLFGVKLQITSYPMLILLFISTLTALFGLGMIFSSLFLVMGRAGEHLTNLLQEPIYLVSGFYFPVRSLGFWIATGATIIPTTLGLDGMRQLTSVIPDGSGFLPVPVEIGILLGLAIIFILIAHWAFYRLEEIGRRDGKLTLKWQ